MPAAIARINPSALRPPSGYAYAVEVRDAYRRLSIAGQVGVRPDGSLPESGEEQIAQAWANVLTILAAAGMTTANLVKTTVYLTERSLLGPFRAERARVLGDTVPASTLVFVSGLVDPRMVVEIEAEAAA